MSLVNDLSVTQAVLKPRHSGEGRGPQPPICSTLRIPVFTEMTVEPNSVQIQVD